nr:PREDICTED: nucleoporin-like protein 2 [Bemisia tabaci]
MALCRFFAQGYCRFGNNCRYEHSNYASYSQGNNRNYRDGGNRGDYRRNDNYHWQKGGKGGGGGNTEVDRIAQAIREEVIVIENGNMWPFTCYSPLAQNGNFKGWEDYSPEEMRYEMWKAYQTNTQDTYDKAIRTLHDSFREKRRKLKTINQETLLEVRDYLNSSPESGYGILNNASYIFQSSTSVFGNSGSSQNFSFASAFGNTASQPSTAASDFSFSQAFSNPTTGSIFGGQTTNTGSIFGGQLPQSGVFGNSQASQQSSVFGQSQLQQQTSIFAQNPSQATIFAQNQPAQNPSQTTVFAPNQPAPQASVFQNTGSIFGGSNTAAPSQSVFGNSFPNSAPAENAFTQPNNFSQNGAFQSEATRSGFGPANPQNNSSFPQAFPSNSQQSLFSNNAANNNSALTQVSAFPSIPSVGTNSSTSVFSPVDSLSEDELLAFKAQTFSFKKIPLSAPPESLCY